jgi:hypothetical protein
MLCFQDGLLYLKAAHPERASPEKADVCKRAGVAYSREVKRMLHLSILKTASGFYYSVVQPYKMPETGKWRSKTLLYLGNEEAFQSFLKMLHERHNAYHRGLAERQAMAECGEPEGPRDT